MTSSHPYHPHTRPPTPGGTSRPVPPVPAYLAHRPTIAGLVVPYITAQTAEGRFLFGAIDPRRLAHCLTGYLCQVCGRRLERPVVLLMRERDLTRQCVSEPACHPVISTAQEARSDSRRPPRSGRLRIVLCTVGAGRGQPEVPLLKLPARERFCRQPQTSSEPRDRSPRY